MGMGAYGFALGGDARAGVNCALGRSSSRVRCGSSGSPAGAGLGFFCPSATGSFTENESPVQCCLCSLMACSVAKKHSLVTAAGSQPVLGEPWCLRGPVTPPSVALVT